MIRVARKLPVEILCLRWTGDNVIEMRGFVGDKGIFYNSIDEDGNLVKELDLLTLEGRMHATIGDMIICGVDGEFYACRYSIFLKTYEFVDKSNWVAYNGIVKQI